MPAKPSPYLISYYPPRPSAPWKLELRTSFSGKRIRKFFATKDEEAAGPLLVAQIRAKGLPSLDEKKSAAVLLSGVLAAYRKHRTSSVSERHLRTGEVVPKK